MVIFTSRTSGLDHEGGSGAGGGRARHGPHARAGAGYPPSTMSTCMLYTGVDLRTMEPVYTRDPHGRPCSALIQFASPRTGW
ncbi:MAG: hypothetical protein ACLSVD_08800 [Eggerthellaceae bacterium]